MTKSRNNEEAELLAIEALGFIAQNENLLERFVSMSGIAPETLRRAAESQGFLAGILGFLLNHEPDLLEFCAAAQKKPESVAKAFAQLPGGENTSF